MIKWRVKKLAESKGWNITQLATESGMAYSSVLDYWHNNARRISLVTMDKLCDALGCAPGDLFEHQPGVMMEEDIESLDLEPALVSDF